MIYNKRPLIYIPRKKVAKSDPIDYTQRIWEMNLQSYPTVGVAPGAQLGNWVIPILATMPTEPTFSLDYPVSIVNSGPIGATGANVVEWGVYLHRYTGTNAITNMLPRLKWVAQEYYNSAIYSTGDIPYIWWWNNTGDDNNVYKLINSDNDPEEFFNIDINPTYGYVGGNSSNMQVTQYNLVDTDSILSTIETKINAVPATTRMSMLLFSRELTDSEILAVANGLSQKYRTMSTMATLTAVVDFDIA